MSRIKIYLSKCTAELEGRTSRRLPQLKKSKKLWVLKAENGVLSKIVDLKDYNDEECLYFTLEAGQTLPKQRDIFYYELAFDRINGDIEYSDKYEVYVKDDDMVTRVTLGNQGLYEYIKFHEDEKGTDLVDTDILNEMISKKFHFSPNAEFLDDFEIDEIEW